MKLVGLKVWMAIAIAVPSRLWLGGAISASRDLALVRRVAEAVRACACRLDILVCVDGFSRYVKAFLGVFRNPVYTGKVGRPRLVLAEGLLPAQVVRSYAKRRVESVARRVAHGTAGAVAAVFERLGGGKDISTADNERLNATFRAHLAVLVRRGRAIVWKESVVITAMYLVGCAYDFRWHHDSLRLAAPAGAVRKWQERTPAMAAGLADHRWSLSELLHYKVARPPWVPPKHCRRPPKAKAPVAAKGG